MKYKYQRLDDRTVALIKEEALYKGLVFKSLAQVIKMIMFSEAEPKPKASNEQVAAVKSIMRDSEVELKSKAGSTQVRLDENVWKKIEEEAAKLNLRTESLNKDDVNTVLRHMIEKFGKSSLRRPATRGR